MKVGSFHRRALAAFNELAADEQARIQEALAPLFRFFSNDLFRSLQEFWERRELALGTICMVRVSGGAGAIN